MIRNLITGEEVVVTLTAEEQAERDAGAQITAERIAAEESLRANEEILNTRLDAAMDGLRAYIGHGTPTNAQTVATVKLLCRVVLAMIRLHRRKLDAVD